MVAKFLMWVSVLSLLFCTQSLSAKTIVTTYVTETQEKRRSTRWTLTEWLRIKERMKLMDLWLAMVSNPKKDKFAPELSLAYGKPEGDLSLSNSVNPVESELGARSAQVGRVQFWFTNLISSTTGLKTPNVDIGFDYGLRKADDLDSALSQQYVSGSQTLSLIPRNYTYTTGNFRIFGKNIQDTSLVLKWGNYSTDKGFTDSLSELDSEVTGLVSGAESYFYFLSWLGIEGNYLKFGNKKGPAGSDELSGELLEYGGFIEIYNLRIGYGEYKEEWSWEAPSYDLKYKESGQMLNVKLQF